MKIIPLLWKNLLISVLMVASTYASAQGEINVSLFYEHSNKIEVPSGTQVQSINYSHHELGLVGKIEAYLSQGIKDDSAASQELAKSKITDEVKQRLGNAWQSHIYAADLGITHVPAIIINNQFVYYGASVNKALELWGQRQ